MAHREGILALLDESDDDEDDVEAQPAARPPSVGIKF